MEAITLALIIGILALAGAAGAGLAIAHAGRGSRNRAEAQLAQERHEAEQAQQRLEAQQAQQRLESQLATLAATQQAVIERIGSIDGRLDQRLEGVMNTVDRRLQDMSSTVGTRLEAVDTRVGQGFSTVQTDLNKTLNSQNETMGRIGEQLGVLDQSAKRIMEVGQDVTSLKDVLSPPKLRGAFGEMLLEQLLKQVLPAEHYQTQYQFRDGTRVDVVITTPDGLVPVDSKFPIDSYRRLLDATNEEERTRLRKAFMRDVRARVEEVAKYIRPHENTMDFACMYVPAEGIFYEIIAGSDEDSMTFALERQVHLVSPNTFFALLQVVSRGLQRLKVQQDVKEFMARLSHVRRDFTKFREEFDRLGKHLGNARNKYDELDKWADKIDNRLAASADEPIQAPLPDAAMAPAPLVPSLTNGNGHREDE